MSVDGWELGRRLRRKVECLLPSNSWTVLFSPLSPYIGHSYYRIQNSDNKTIAKFYIYISRKGWELGRRDFKKGSSVFFPLALKTLLSQYLSHAITLTWSHPRPLQVKSTNTLRLEPTRFI